MYQFIVSYTYMLLSLAALSILSTWGQAYFRKPSSLVAITSYYYMKKALIVVVIVMLHTLLIPLNWNYNKQFYNLTYINNGKWEPLRFMIILHLEHLEIFYILLLRVANICNQRSPPYPCFVIIEICFQLSEQENMILWSQRSRGRAV